MRPFLYCALLLLVACNSQSSTEKPQTVLIFDDTLAQAYQDKKTSMKEERTPIEFQGGQVARDCSGYIELKNSYRMAEGVNNQIIKSEYLICDALHLLKTAKATEAKAPESIESLYSQLDLTSFPSALRPQLQDGVKTLEQLSGSILESTPQRLTVEVNGVHTTFTLAAITDATGSGKGDWILWLEQTIPDGNYYQYQTLTVASTNSNGMMAHTDL